MENWTNSKAMVDVMPNALAAYIPNCSVRSKFLIQTDCVLVGRWVGGYVCDYVCVCVCLSKNTVRKTK